MILNQKGLARRALAASLRTRMLAQRAMWEPICVYDVAELLEVDVRFLDVPSMEGLYSKQPGPLILLPSERPCGRQSYSCAHELGHHIAGHGTRVDQIVEQKPVTPSHFDDPDEFFAECFAGFLLMPKVAVEHAFSQRGWNFGNLTAEQIYIIAGLLGVGYTTLLNHMCRSLGILGRTQAESLLKNTPNQIRRGWLGQDKPNSLVVVDEYWTGRPIDVQVGDFLLAPRTVNVDCQEMRRVRDAPSGVILQAGRPGIGRLSTPGNCWANFVRVSRPAYVGLAKYRHLEEIE